MIERGIEEGQKPKESSEDIESFVKNNKEEIERIAKENGVTKAGTQDIAIIVWINSIHEGKLPKDEEVLKRVEEIIKLLKREEFEKHLSQFKLTGDKIQP